MNLKSKVILFVLLQATNVVRHGAVEVWMKDTAYGLNYV